MPSAAIPPAKPPRPQADPPTRSSHRAHDAPGFFHTHRTRAMTAALLFFATFALVSLLGLQQLTVERGHKLAAFITSPLISGAYLVLFKLLPGPTDLFQIAMHMLGGALGIVASMVVHPYLVGMLRGIPPRPPAPDSSATHTVETARLATELAERHARQDIESYCVAEKLGRYVWYDTATALREGADVEEIIDRAIRYLNLRKLIAHHPQHGNLVRFPR